MEENKTDWKNRSDASMNIGNQILKIRKELKTNPDYFDEEAQCNLCFTEESITAFQKEEAARKGEFYMRITYDELAKCKENVYHSYLYGNRKLAKNVQKTTTLTDFQISQIDFLRQYYTLNQLAKLFNINYQTLKNITMKITKRKRLDNQQPSIYKDIYK